MKLLINIDKANPKNRSKSPIKKAKAKSKRALFVEQMRANNTKQGNNTGAIRQKNSSNNVNPICKPASRKWTSGAAPGKTYLTEIEDCSESAGGGAGAEVAAEGAYIGAGEEDGLEEEEDDVKGFMNTHVKNLEVKSRHVQRLTKQFYGKMKFVLDCGFNLLLFGVGSKIDFINLFC